MQCFYNLVYETITANFALTRLKQVVVEDYYHVLFIRRIPEDCYSDLYLYTRRIPLLNTNSSFVLTRVPDRNDLPVFGIPAKHDKDWDC